MPKKKNTENEIKHTENPDVMGLRAETVEQPITETLETNYMPYAMCVVKRSESVEIRKLVKNIDEDAFLIVTDAKNVFGRGFGDISDLS